MYCSHYCYGYLQAFCQSSWMWLESSFAFVWYINYLWLCLEKISQWQNVDKCRHFESKNFVRLSIIFQKIHCLHRIILDINTVIHTRTALLLTVMLGLSLSLHKYMNILTETRALLMTAFIDDKLEFISYITENAFHLQWTEQPIHLLQGNNPCLFWGSRETHKIRLGRFTRKQEKHYSFYRRVGGLSGPFGSLGKISAIPGFKLRTVQPVASRCICYQLSVFFILLPRDATLVNIRIILVTYFSVRFLLRQ
jgi:hypothetical protein